MLGMGRFKMFIAIFLLIAGYFCSIVWFIPKWIINIFFHGQIKFGFIFVTQGFNVYRKVAKRQMDLGKDVKAGNISEVDAKIELQQFKREVGWN